DPGTTVIGNVLDENQNPLSGVPVATAGNRSSVSGPDGSFSISDVPTVQGDIVVVGSFNPPDGRVIQGKSIGVAPVRDGLTMVGNIVIPSCGQQPLGAVSWWPLDELSGTTTIDVISGKNGVFSGTAPINGQVLGARRFVLNDSMLAPGDGPLDIIGNQVTIEAWLKLENNPTTAQVFTGVIGKTTFPNKQAYQITFESGDLASNPSRALPQNQWQMEYILINTSGFRVHNQTTNIIVDVDGEFHHFAMTYDGISVRLYVDGIQKGSFPYSGNLKSLPSEPIEVFGGTPFSADEISIYARALTASEINDLYLAGKSGAGMCLP
ncbi:MAG: LamG domain-containing protein, partial [Nitrospirota bacterium]|nr:LamG domain-containing protein [Nitrospirota bacterium]